MKDNLKRVMAVMLSAIMVVSLMMTNVVYAATAKTGSIKLTSSTQPLNGRTFEAYQLFNLTNSGNNFAYTQVSKKVTDEIVAAVNEAVTNYNKVKDQDLAFATTSADAKTIVKFLQDQKDNASFLNYFANALQNHKASLGKAHAANLNVEEKPILNASIDNLPYGYYVVIETTTLDAEKKDQAVSIAMLNNVYGKEENVIKVKSEIPSVDKTIQKGGEEVKGNDYHVGDDIIFNLNGKAPSDYVLSTYETYHYTFHDTLSKGLSVDSIAALQLAVTINNEPANFVVNSETGVITKDGVAVGSVQFSKQDDGTTKLTVDFDLKAEPMKALFAKDNNKEVKNKIKVTYHAVLNKDAVLGEPGNENKVYIEYNNNPFNDEKGKSTEDQVYSYTYGLDITKTDGTTHTVLPGATFKLYTNEACTDEYDIWATQTADGKYVYSKTEGLPATNEFTVDAQGKLVINGLASGTYYLKEIVAPDGYNLLEKPVKIEIKATYDETGKLTNLEYKINDALSYQQGHVNTGYVDVTVENFSGAILPETGGMGTTMLYLVGIFAIAAGLGYFVMDKKRSNAQK